MSLVELLPVTQQKMQHNKNTINEESNQGNRVIETNLEKPAENPSIQEV